MEWGKKEKGGRGRGLGRWRVYEECRGEKKGIWREGEAAGGGVGWGGEGRVRPEGDAESKIEREQEAKVKTEGG